jgi:hypothetical protein
MKQKRNTPVDTYIILALATTFINLGCNFNTYMCEPIKDPDLPSNEKINLDSFNYYVSGISQGTASTHFIQKI